MKNPYLCWFQSSILNFKSFDYFFHQKLGIIKGCSSTLYQLLSQKPFVSFLDVLATVLVRQGWAPRVCTGAADRDSYGTPPCSGKPFPHTRRHRHNLDRRNTKSCRNWCPWLQIDERDAKSRFNHLGLFPTEKVLLPVSMFLDVTRVAAKVYAVQADVQPGPSLFANGTQTWLSL